MFVSSSALPRSLLAAATAAFLLSAASTGEAANWPFNWGKAAPAAVGDGSITVAQAAGDADRLNRVEAEMRTLTGQIEALTHQLQMLQDQLKRMQDDTEFRFSELKGGAAGAAKGAQPANNPPAADVAAAEQPPVPPPPAKTVTPTPAEVAVAQSKTDNGTQLGAPPKSLGTIALDAPVLDAPPAGGQPLDLSSLATDQAQPQAPAAAPNNTQVASIAPTGDARADYDQAYKLVTAGRYDVAETAFRQFLVTYPNDELAPDAQYWLGESLYAHGNYAAAAKEFQTGYTKYPKSKRAPDALLKLGLSMAGLDSPDVACKMYALDLKQYPQMSNGLRQRVKAEQASAGC